MLACQALQGLRKALTELFAYCRKLEEAVKAMLTSLPLVSELSHPAMRPRHWKQLMKAQTPFSFDALLPKFAYCASGDTPCDGIEKCKSSKQNADGGWKYA